MESLNTDQAEWEEVEELLEKQIRKKVRAKHRGYGDYEKRIYRGPSVKRVYK
ncbi:MAG: hypothetical protein WBL02_04035 [Methanomethylovorans sp.]|uniref:hypothetical protein n=1 Tax=Methanomethylovorans sp. TaxID=2758717 RepID=UPI001BD3BD2F|nr:hypothetical protein [Methanomethylovorans sp.]